MTLTTAATTNITFL